MTTRTSWTDPVTPICGPLRLIDTTPTPWKRTDVYDADDRFIGNFPRVWAEQIRDAVGVRAPVTGEQVCHNVIYGAQDGYQITGTLYKYWPRGSIFINRRVAERRRPAPGERSDDQIKRRVLERRGSYLHVSADTIPIPRAELERLRILAHKIPPQDRHLTGWQAAGEELQLALDEMVRR